MFFTFFKFSKCYQIAQRITYALPNAKANSIVKVILDVIHQMSLKIENARGQCYDGAATMSGTKRGVANHIKSLNKLYTHCYEHALNLAVND